MNFQYRFPRCNFRGTNRKDYLWKHLKRHKENDPAVEKILRKYFEDETRDAKVPGENQKHFEILEAAKEGDQEKMRDLLLNIDIKSKEQGRSVVHQAARDGLEGVMKTLIENGAEMQKRSSSGETPFFLAIKSGHEAIVKLLLDNGQSAHARSNGSTGIAAISMAIRHKHEAVLKILLQYGAVNVTSWDKIGTKTALHEAVRAGPAITELMIGASADLNVRNANNQSPLYCALLYPVDYRVVSLLLDAGAPLYPDYYWMFARIPPEIQKRYAEHFQAAQSFFTKVAIEEGVEKMLEDEENLSDVLC